MKAAVFVRPGKIELREKPIPQVGPTDALVRITTTTICGTDVHILKGEYPVNAGLTIGHEPVGVIEQLGSAITGYEVGQRVIAGAESGHIRIGDSVAVFAQGPIGLCATAGGRLSGASLIIAIDGIESRLQKAKSLGAHVTLNYNELNPVEAIMDLTRGRGVDVSIEALGTQNTFESCLRVVRPGGTVSSLGVYSGKLTLPLDALAAGLGDHKIVTTLCPGGKERMRRLMSTVASGAADLRSLVTHRFKLDEIEKAYDLFANQRDGVLKVAITP